MQAWEQNSFSAKWCTDMRLDVRGLNFAREVRRQLTDLVKRADFLPDRQLFAQGKGSKRRRDSDGDLCTHDAPVICVKILVTMSAFVKELRGLTLRISGRPLQCTCLPRMEMAPVRATYLLCTLL